MSSRYKSGKDEQLRLGLRQNFVEETAQTFNIERKALAIPLELISRMIWTN